MARLQQTEGPFFIDVRLTRSDVLYRHGGDQLLVEASQMRRLHGTGSTSDWSSPEYLRSNRSTD